MKSVEFCYWLQGLFELGEPKSLTEKQTELIRRHLDMVFLHDIDRSYPAEEQAALNAAHAGRPSMRSTPPSPPPAPVVVPLPVPVRAPEPRPEPLPVRPGPELEPPRC